MTFAKLAAPALALLAVWSAAPADARIIAPVAGAPTNAAPTLIDDKDGRPDQPRSGDAQTGEDDDENDDLDMMDMGEDDEDDDDDDDRSGDDADDRRERDGDRRN